MAQIRPFPAGRPPKTIAARVASVPYDVVDTKEALSLARGNPVSFLHVCRPEIDLPAGTDLYADAVYAKGRENLDRFYAEGTLVADPAPRLFVYRQTWRGRKQDGLVAACSVDDYDADVIKKHEKTRLDKENDRVRHLLTQSAHAEPVFLTYRAVPAIDAKVREVTSQAPEYDFEAPDGVRHALWLVPQAENGFFTEAFAKVPFLYVADGHHRSASASRARAALREKDPKLSADHPVNWFPATIFPDGELAILPYNRVVKDLGGKSPGEFLAAVREAFRIRHGAGPEPEGKGEFRLYFSGAWHGLTPIAPVDAKDPIGSLDVSVLADRLLAPILGIADQRTDKRIDFVGGIRGTKELEARVDAGGAAVAFSLFPTTVADLMAIADVGAIMPPKSTWFEPKLRSGLFVHRF
ncbi:MAG TPA: DUF1015 family protein [Thermoanaerobaculia bacterium]|nr:DUF1015 family protein [Thermoanaerobaculia bacterium]HQR66146.1 DUF1015 family protein [Thermoanaerobaculia bacterium]